MVYDDGPMVGLERHTDVYTRGRCADCGDLSVSYIDPKAAEDWVEEHRHSCPMHHRPPQGDDSV